MKSRTLRNLCLAFWLGGTTAAFAQGSAFTYQGRLSGTNGPLNGLYDLIFLVYDSPANPVPLVSGYPVSATSVSNGLFTATIDFGPGVFTGANRWLGINVRTNGAGVFTELLPRQAVTAAPYAITAAQVSSGGIAAGAYTNAVVFSNPGNSFAGAFSGSGAALSGVNAATLAGLGTNNLWLTSGNRGTAPALNFLGTTDNQALELRANNLRAWRLEPTTAIDGPNLIGGNASNSVAPGTVGATIGGGGIGLSGSANLILSGANYATVGGGSGNLILSGANNATVAGGIGNQSDASYATVAGGSFNQAEGSQSTVSGGNINNAGGLLSTVGGGRQNWAWGEVATIGGGYGNQVWGHYSFIGGGQNNTASGDLAFIGAGAQNTIQTNAYQATIAGGVSNVVFTAGPLSVVGGGSNNLAGGLGAVIAGGIHNSAGQSSTVAGGLFNEAEYSSVVSGGTSNSAYGAYNSIGGGWNNNIDIDISGCTIGGGQNNVISWRYTYLDGYWATVSGGIGNLAVGEAATIPGGSNNVAYGAFSFAAGKNAAANHVGTFVWADSQDGAFASTASNQFAIRAANGLVIQAATNSTALEVRTGGALKVTGAGVGTATPVFIHRAVSGSNISGNVTTIDHPLCNGDPNAILIVTPNYNPGGTGGVYDNHPIGVYYTGSHWSIFNQDVAAMPNNAAFNVLVVKP